MVKGGDGFDGDDEYARFRRRQRIHRMHLVGYAVSAGGMPSSHSAFVAALACAVGFTDGFDEPYAMIAVGFGLLVVCDAATVRRQAGEHAKLLNIVIGKLNDRLDADERIEVRS